MDRGALRRHNRVDTEEKLFECSYCLKMFSQKDNLDVHIRVHTKEKPFKCLYCSKTFSHKQCLNRHIRIHTKKSRLNVCIVPERFFENNI